MAQHLQHKEKLCKDFVFPRVPPGAFQICARLPQTPVSQCLVVNLVLQKALSSISL